MHRRPPHRKQGNEVQHKSHQKPQQKVRGGWLTAAIIFVILHGLVMFGVALGENGFTTSDLPNWFIYSLIGVAIADIVAGIALWLWKGWGFYLYLVATIVVIGLGLLATGSMLFAFSRIVPFAIVGYIMRDKWRYFE